MKKKGRRAGCGVAALGCGCATSPLVFLVLIAVLVSLLPWRIIEQAIEDSLLPEIFKGAVPLYGLLNTAALPRNAAPHAQHITTAGSMCPEFPPLSLPPRSNAKAPGSICRGVLRVRRV